MGRHRQSSRIEVGMSETVFDRVQSLLTRHGVEFDVPRHEAVYTSEEAAAVRGTPLASGAKEERTSFPCFAWERCVPTLPRRWECYRLHRRGTAKRSTVRYDAKHRNESLVHRSKLTAQSSRLIAQSSRLMPQCREAWNPITRYSSTAGSWPWVSIVSSVT